MAHPDPLAFRRLARVKRIDAIQETLGADMVKFFKHSIQKPQKQIGNIGECWNTLIPSTLIDHTALQSFTKGTLTVLVDSSAHLYELRTLLLSGLQDQILLACRSGGLRKIMLKHGRWYQGDGAEKRIRFD